MTLRATTLLADNTSPLLRSVCSALDASGVPIEFDESTDLEDRMRLVEREEYDVVLACGLLTARLVDGGVGLDVDAAPVFPGEQQPVYRSVIVCRADAPYQTLDDAMSGRVAINDLGSWSGWHGLVSFIQDSLGDRSRAVSEADPYAVPEVGLATGGHTRSIRAVATGRADVAAIDSSVWNHAAIEDQDSVAALRVLCTTDDWPAPPLSILTSTNAQLWSRLIETIGTLPNFQQAAIADYQFMLDAFSRTSESNERDISHQG